MFFVEVSPTTAPLGPPSPAGETADGRLALKVPLTPKRGIAMPAAPALAGAMAELVAGNFFPARGEGLLLPPLGRNWRAPDDT